MDVFFRTSKLQKDCSDTKRCDRRWGPQNGKKIRQRLAELAAAETVAGLMKLPEARCHLLKGNRADQFAVDTKGGKRLVFEPAHDPVQRTNDGGIDLTRITKIRILEVVDYH